MKKYMILGLVEEGSVFSDWVDELITDSLAEAHLYLETLREKDPQGTFYLMEMLA